MMSDKYYRVCKSVMDKGVLVNAGHDFDQYKGGEAFVSAFHYNEKHKEQFDKLGSVAGITDVKTNIIYFDLDNKNIEQARKDSITVVDRLKGFGIASNQVRICLSGLKGFHLALHTTTDFTPKEVKSLATDIAGDLASFDSVIYNANRIIRIEGCVHKGANLRKTPIAFDELKDLSIAELKDIANSEYDYEKPVKITLGKSILKLTETKESVKIAEDTGESVDYFSNPYSLQPWKLALSQGFFPAGQRSTALLILGATLRNKNLNETQCFYALKASAEMQSDRYGDDPFTDKEIKSTIIKQIFSPTWKGGSYAEDDFPTQLQSYFEELGVPRQEFKEVANSTVKLGDEFASFTRYAESINENTLHTGIKELDKALKIRKGHLIGLIAPPSVGKTSFALTLLNNTSKQGVPSFFGSYDMYKNNVVAKLIQRESQEKEERIYQHFIDKNHKKIEEYKQLLEDNYGEVSFCFKSGQSVKEMRQSIKMEEEKTGKDILLVVVDYLELVKTEKSDPTMSSAEAIQGLREIANEGKVVLVLLQPNKMGSKINEPMRSYNAAKGSSSIAQACTAIMGCWREGMSPDTPDADKYFSINILKNRNGALASLDFSWDGPTQRITSLDAEGKAMLNHLRDAKREEKDKDDDSW